MRIHTAPELASLVREARQRARLSQAGLAARIGASRQWVQRLEAGVPGVELGLTLRALTALGVHLHAAWGDGGAAPSGDRSIEGRERSQEQIGHEASPRPKASAWYEELPGWKVDGRPDAVEAPDIDLLLRRPPREGE